MYKFVDVNNTSEGNILPSEALKINGKYIENEIIGYRTLNVQGREALSPDVVTYTTGARDGSRLQSRRYPERIITVTYQIVAETNEAFRAAYNKLGRILDVQDAELIFNDEPDKFFVGTPCIIDSVEPGRNAVVGNFEILCADPFKYSVIEYEAEPDADESSILVDYGGTYKAFPTLEADFCEEFDTSDDGETAKALTGVGDCGYVAFFTEDEKIVQIGDPDEVNVENYAKSQTLVNTTFKKSNSWGTAAKAAWKVNSGVDYSDSVVRAGTVAMAAVTESTTATDTSGTLLNATSKASAPIIHYQITAKTSGRTSNSVKVSFSVKTWLDKDASYFGNGYSLQGSIYIGGSWRNVTLKKTTDYWRGKTGHTVNLTVTVSGVSASATALTGIKFKVTRPDGLGQAGTLAETACADLKISASASGTAKSYYLAPSSYGSGDKWHGASITRTIPKDDAGDAGAANFTLSYSQKMSIGNTKDATNQRGSFRVLLVSGSGTNRAVVAAVYVDKNSVGKKAKLKFYVGGSLKNTTEVDLSYNNKRFNADVSTTTVQGKTLTLNIPKTSTITKTGATVSFNIAGIKKIFKDADIENTVITQVTFEMLQYGTKAPLTYNGMDSVKFVKNNCVTWENIPNKFSAGDIVEADCRNGAIYLNGVLTPALGALGNDWEEFVLTPGLNQIGVSHSDWVHPNYAPTFKVRYREVFL